MAALPEPSKFLRVIGKYGDRAMDFSAKHWKVLLGAAAFTAFVNDPEPYLDGAKNLADVAAASTLKPIADNVGRATDWTWILSYVVAGMVLLLAFRMWLGRRTAGAG
ncbi:MAG: hypothetical protein QM811_16970 [Pirellulales bacterium]